MRIKTTMDLTNEQIDKVKAEIEKEHGTLDDVESAEISPEGDGEIMVRYKVSGEPKVERIRRIN
jgi:hypothetical protein